MSKMRQTNNFNEEQFSNGVDDEYGDEIMYDEERDSSNNDEEDVRSQQMQKASSSFNLSKGAVIATIIILTVAILIIFVFKPFSGGDGEGFSIGKFFGRDGSIADDVLGGNSTKSYADSLIEYLEGYTVEDKGDGTYLVKGEKDGQPHEMTYDSNFNMLSEKLGENLTTYEVDEATGERVPTTPLTEGNVSTTDTSSEIVEGDSMVKVDRWSYEHSQLGMPVTDLKFEYDENGVLIAESYDDKFIVEYTRLPIRGHTPQVHVKIMETDIQLIFNVSIDNYLKLSDTGASLITARVTEVGGQKMFSNIRFDEWK